MYKPGSSVGNGSTADAIRYEKATGEFVGGKTHVQKGEERIKNLENILKKEVLDKNDQSIVNALINDLKNALYGN